MSSQGLEGVLVNPGLDHDGDSVLFVHLKFRLVKPGINPRLLSDSTISCSERSRRLANAAIPISATTSMPISGSWARRVGEWPVCISAGPGRLIYADPSALRATPYIGQPKA